ncbi:hypothetical protein [Niallia sp. NCCP-28]|uniref:hypothetical protein n=1 Tax=Niallia sp. NCCP-28 TaxID=2934712 RepID=UPI0020808856|nr:hypothetical protein [Niallia sp. NCCP-28]GKU82046.1 hypothetical protein NCCP28_14420 [Niallia sp. NCCP-28]
MEGLGLIINILTTVYLAVDARKHNKSPILWAILGFVFGLLALAVYFIRTERKLIGWILLVVVSIVYILIILFFIAVLFMSFS